MERRGQKSHKSKSKIEPKNKFLLLDFLGFSFVSPVSFYERKANSKYELCGLFLHSFCINTCRCIVKSENVFEIVPPTVVLVKWPELEK